MSTSNVDNTAETKNTLESGTYEIIRNRLNNHGEELRRRLAQLNEDRKNVFGAIETRLLGTARITTAHNCIPRDMVSIGNHFLFGYNVHIGLKTETALSDVFAVYEFRDGTFHEQSIDLIRDERFEKDFHDVYRYYKNAVFAKFFTQGPLLYMVFRVGKSPNDIKTFKWSIQNDKLIYIDNRSDHEVRYPPQHQFEWKRTHRDLHYAGLHPHVSIEDKVFVETLGGDLTIKIENNTDSGEGIYSEPVDDPDQTLDDAEIFYAIVGNIILLKIRPYQEKNFRYIVYNEKIQRAQRLDSIRDACVLLPDDHGLIFSNGYYLQTGESKIFEEQNSGMLFEKRIDAPNGEDFLYVFYHRETGDYILLQYNLIAQQVETPIVCNGQTFFEGGEMVCFKTQETPQKHHTVQIWQTPYVGEDFVSVTNDDSYLYKIGNKEIVRAMAECHEVLALIAKEDTYADLYVDITKESGDILDSYFWIHDEQTHDLGKPLTQIKDAASAAVEEFDKVVRVKQNTARESARVQKQVREILADVSHRRFEHINDFVESLAEMRRVRGEIISLKELRYVEEALIESLETEVAEQTDRTSHRCVEFLLNPQALTPYIEKVEQERSGIDGLTKVSDAKIVEEEISKTAAELEMLIEIVGNLQIDDATHRTTIIDNISAIFSTVNQARASLKTKLKELASVEGVAEFNSQLKLLSQSVVNYLDLCETPEKCEEYLTKIMIQLEELEGKFAEFDEFILQLSEKRDEVYNAFESRKLSLVEARNKRANALAAAADRILKGIKNRVEQFETVNDINSYFAADLMIEKVRDLCEQLTDLDDTVKVDDIQSRLKTIREDAVRQLKDRQELFVDGKNVIKFGDHRFSVNVQALDLTTVLRDDAMNLHLTGTNFFEEIHDEILNATRPAWEQEVVSENHDVYRAEYLAYEILHSNDEKASLENLLKYDQAELLAFVAKFMGPRYSEGYVKGVHDHDAALLVKSLAEMQSSIGMLRYHTRARALGTIFWRHFVDEKTRSKISAKLQGVGIVSRLFPGGVSRERDLAELKDLLFEFVSRHHLFPEEFLDDAAVALYEEVSRTEPGHETVFTVSRVAADLFDAFQSHLKQYGIANSFAESVQAVEENPVVQFLLTQHWVKAFLHQAGNENELEYADEVTALLMHGRVEPQAVIDARTTVEISGMTGTHPVIQDGTYQLDYNRFQERLNRFCHEAVPRFHKYVDRKKEIVEHAREEMKLEEFRPRVLTSFVRNRLIDEVYLPLVGDNLAKQIGTAGESKRTDRMGLLLLISPPGYGKTTLMEYIANRLGIIFMKINGPAIGHQVTSLDPEEAPNAAAREEVNKLNLALEMGDNVMIYLDDIQHCNPEFLQKFISLCDATRKIEGVYKGKTRTYDLRGRKVAVVMAGNPYTESGEKFQIPDMLSNRADIYNLGEIIGDSADAFELSYLENSLTSNATLNPLATRSQKDVYAVIKLAEGVSRDGVELEGNYSLEELNEMVAVMKKLIRIRDVILTVNREYIRSAAQSDDYRTEPPFKLQGSYRNMNRMAEKVVPIMNDQELESLILSSYENDAQTLTSDTEANLLKLKELIGHLSDEESKRWENIKRTFQKNVKMRGIDTSDKAGQVIAQLSTFGDGLDSIRDALTSGVEKLASRESESENSFLDAHAEREYIEQQVERLADQLQGLRDALSAIEGSLTGGISQLEKLASQQTGRRSESSANPSSVSAASIAPSVEETEKEPETADESIPPKITVVNKIPPTLLNVLQQQFELMQGWMAPILQASNAQSAEIQELQKRIETCLKDYEALVKRVEGSRPSRKKITRKKKTPRKKNDPGE
ncbi:MAG: DNA repair ATPase [Planctomycetaceae bacterium]